MFRCQERSTEPVWRFGPSQRRPGNPRRVREQDGSAARLDLLRHLAGPHHLARSREPSAWRLHHSDCDCVRPCGEQKSRTTKNWNSGQLLGDGGRGILRSKKQPPGAMSCARRAGWWSGGRREVKVIGDARRAGDRRAAQMRETDSWDQQSRLDRRRAPPYSESPQ